MPGSDGSQTGIDSSVLLKTTLKKKGKSLRWNLKFYGSHLEESIMMDGYDNRVDPDKWKPLIMSFQKFYSLGDQLQNSKLAEIAENLYHSQDMDNARN